MFIESPFTIARTWKQAKCPSTEKWIKKTWCTYTVEYYSTIKRNKMWSFVETWVDLETYTKWSKSEREIQISYISAYMWNPEKWYRWSYLQSRNRETEVQNKCIDTEGRGGANWEIGIDTYTPLILHIKQITNEKLLYSRGLYSMLCGDLSGKEIQKRGDTANSLCCAVETNTTLLKQLYSNKN